jgi:hypothetical protein
MDQFRCLSDRVFERLREAEAEQEQELLLIDDLYATIARLEEGNKQIRVADVQPPRVPAVAAPVSACGDASEAAAASVVVTEERTPPHADTTLRVAGCVVFTSVVLFEFTCTRLDSSQPWRRPL